MTRLRTLLLLSALLAVRVGAQSPSPLGATIELPESREARLVTLRLTLADGQRVGFATPINVRTTATFEGDVTNLPLGASVWLAVRDTETRDQPWRVLFPAATADETGHWQDRVDVSCDNGRTNCELMAFVSNQVVERQSHDDNWFRQNAYKRTQSVEIQILPPNAGPQPSGALQIGTVADTPSRCRAARRGPVDVQRRRHEPPSGAGHDRVGVGSVFAVEDLGAARPDYHRHGRHVAHEPTHAPANPGHR